MAGSFANSGVQYLVKNARLLFPTGDAALSSANLPNIQIDIPTILKQSQYFFRRFDEEVNFVNRVKAINIITTVLESNLSTTEKIPIILGVGASKFYKSILGNDEACISGSIENDFKTAYLKSCQKLLEDCITNPRLSQSILTPKIFGRVFEGLAISDRQRLMPLLIQNLQLSDDSQQDALQILQIIRDSKLVNIDSFCSLLKISVDAKDIACIVQEVTSGGKEFLGNSELSTQLNYFLVELLTQMTPEERNVCALRVFRQKSKVKMPGGKIKIQTLSDRPKEAELFLTIVEDARLVKKDGADSFFSNDSVFTEIYNLGYALLQNANEDREKNIVKKCIMLLAKSEAKENYALELVLKLSEYSDFVFTKEELIELQSNSKLITVFKKSFEMSFRIFNRLEDPLLELEFSHEFIDHIEVAKKLEIRNAEIADFITEFISSAYPDNVALAAIGYLELDSQFCIEQDSYAVESNLNKVYWYAESKFNRRMSVLSIISRATSLKGKQFFDNMAASTLSPTASELAAINFLVKCKKFDQASALSSAIIDSVKDILCSDVANFLGGVVRKYDIYALANSLALFFDSHKFSIQQNCFAIIEAIKANSSNFGMIILTRSLEFITDRRVLRAIQGYASDPLLDRPE